MARVWRDVRSEPGLDEDRVTERRRELDERVRALGLRQVREAQRMNQEDVASLMRVSQSPAEVRNHFVFARRGSSAHGPGLQPSGRCRRRGAAVPPTK